MSTEIATTTKRKRNYENHRSQPRKKISRTSSNDEEIKSEVDDADQNSRTTKTSNKHTKKERKQNRSSRIHSIRKLLARGGLPSTIQQEKERELAALLHDQNAEKNKKQAKKVLEKYHYVRFVERQKAEKRLKQLRKQLQAEEDEDEGLGQKIHDMEVNRNYAIYAPLEEKYVSVFASKNNLNQNMNNSSHDDLAKPSMWYVVERLMLEGQTRLEALRDGKLSANAVKHDPDETSQAEFGIAKSSKKQRQKVKTYGVPSIKRKKSSGEDDQDSDDSGGIAGGFFEM